MNARTNLMNQMRLDNIHKDLFDMANSYASSEYGNIAVRLHYISNLIFDEHKALGVLYPDENTPPDPQHGRGVKSDNRKYNPLLSPTPFNQSSEPEKVKPLAQYLSEYVEYEYDKEGFVSGIDVDFQGQSMNVVIWEFAKLLQQAFNAYESTEQVKIRIERV